MFCPRVVDSPPRGRGQSAWCLSAGCSSCSLCVLERLLFDPFPSCFGVAECLADSPPGVADNPPRGHGQSVWCVILTDGLRCLHRRSIIEDAVLVVRELILDGPPQPRGQSS
jgi:hypothetical protein